MKIKSKCLINNNWVRFNLMTGIYENIIIFLESQNILFASEIKLDFSTIPIELHGKGRSYNLLEYLANNAYDNSLVSIFLQYFLTEILDIRYYITSEKVKFIFSEESNWQTYQIIIRNIYPPSKQYGESVMFIFPEDSNYKFIINNFTSDTIKY